MKTNLASQVTQVVKNRPANTRDAVSVPGLGRSPGEGDGNPLQYPCLGNPMDRGDWQAIVHGVTRVGHNLATKQQQQEYTCYHSLVIVTSCLL